MIIEIIAMLMLGAFVASLAILAGLKTRLTRPYAVRYGNVRFPEYWSDSTERGATECLGQPDLIQEQILDPMYWRDLGAVPGDIRPDPMAPL